MNEQFFSQKTRELISKKDFVRSLIKDKHWQTDGESKELILIEAIRSIIPRNLGVGRGFVVTPENFTSPQIDIVIYDANQTLIHQVGDIVFITPNACEGIIEVKSRITSKNSSAFLKKIAKTGKDINDQKNQPLRFLGLFSYEIEDEFCVDPNKLLKQIQKICRASTRPPIDHICFGPDNFVKFWQNNPDTHANNYKCWHIYKLEEKSYSYFLYNLALAFSSDSVNVRNGYFPASGKEGSIMTSPHEYN